jgi:hypothetical protein
VVPGACSYENISGWNGNRFGASAARQFVCYRPHLIVNCQLRQAPFEIPQDGRFAASARAIP